MVQIGIGFVVILGALAILMGAGDTLRLPVGDIFPLIGLGGVAVIVAVGLMLIAHGLHRRALKRGPGASGAGDRAELRMRGLATAGLIAIAILSVAMPLVAEPLNLVAIGGFPLGFYMAAEGALLALAALAFVSVLRHDAVEREEASHND